MQRTQNINENNDVSGVHVNRFDSSESVDDSEVARGIGERRIRAITGIDLLDRMLYSLQVSDINWINSLKKSFLFLLFISIPLLFVLNPIQRDVVPTVSGLESNVGNYFHDKYEYVRNMVQEVKNRALNFFRESKDKVRDKVDQAEDKMDRMKTKAKEFMEDKKNYLNDKKEQIKEDVHDAKERTKDYLRGKKDRIRDRFEDREERSTDRYEDREQRWGSRDQSRDRDDQSRDRQSRNREDSKESDRVRDLERGISSDRHDTKERETRDTRDTRDTRNTRDRKDREDTRDRDRKDRDDTRDREDKRDVDHHGHLENHYPDDFMPSDRFADSGSDIRADVTRPPIRDIRQYAREHHVDLGEYDPNYVESDVEDEGRSSEQQRYNRRSSEDQYQRDRSDRDRNYERDVQYTRDRSDRRSDYREDERDWERRSSDRDTRDKVRDTRDRVRDVVDEEIPKAVHRVRETKDQVLDKVVDKLEDAKDYLKEKKDQVVDKLGDAKDYLKEKKDEVVDFIKEEAPEVKDYLKEKKDQVVDKLGDAKDYLKEKKDQVVDYFEEEKEDAKRYAKDKKDQAVEKLEDTKKRTKDFVRDKKDRSVDYVDEKMNESTNQKPRTHSRSRQVEEEDKHYESNYRYDSHKDTYVDKNNNKERQRQYESKKVFTSEDDKRKINVDDSNLEGLVTKTSAAVVFKQPFTSATYARFTFKSFFVNVLSHVIGGKDVLNFPANALSDNMEIGHCFSFEGSKGNITIDLKSPVTVKAVSLEHPQTGHLESSPKRFSVFAFNARSLDQLVHYRNSGAEIGSNLIFPKGTVGPKIFAVDERETRFLQFRFLENNGDPEYTCVYRINVLVERP